MANFGIDGATGANSAVDYPHHEVHEGNHYYVEGSATLGDGGILHVKLVTPDTTKWSHFTWEIDSAGILTTTFDEAASGGMVGGSSVTPINNNRNSTQSSGVVITSGVSSTATYALRLSNQTFGAAATPSRITGGGGSRDNELVLKQNTVYLRTFESGTAANNVNFRASWYEHTNKDLFGSLT